MIEINILNSKTVILKTYVFNPENYLIKYSPKESKIEIIQGETRVFYLPVIGNDGTAICRKIGTATSGIWNVIYLEMQKSGYVTLNSKIDQ